MKRLPLVISLAVLALVVVVTGCGGARYDSRLAVADSLMHDHPDSALALVEAVSPASLTTDGDRAYRDLLLTQARYRCYITATTDSDINRALDYYRRHSGEREKLTRAYIYKGAVMEELNHVDSAMFYYKHAEVTAAPDDYFNLGYVKMRMGALYRDHYAMDGKDIEKYESAYQDLLHTNDKHYQIVCMINLGSLYRLNDRAKAENMLQNAMVLAKEINDTTKYLTCAQNLIAMYDYYKIYPKARELIQHVMRFQQNNIGSLFYTNSAKVYAEVGLLDSAQYFLNLSKQKTINGPIEQLSLLECLSEIALARGEHMRHLQYEHQCKQLTDSLKEIQETVKILSSEHEFDQAAKADMKNRHQKSIYWGLAVGAMTLLFLSLLFYRYLHRYDKIIADFRQQSQENQNDLAELQQNINYLKINDVQLKSFITSHMTLLLDVVDACYHAPRNVLSRDIQRIVKFQDNNKDKWEKLYGYIDMEFNDIMSTTKRNYPQLNDKDLLLLALTTMGYSCVQIAIILGYSNATTIGGNRQRLAKKMGLEGSLKEYIQQFNTDRSFSLKSK